MTSSPEKPQKVVSRIFITESGDLVVTDLWDELRDLLPMESKGSESLEENHEKTYSCI